MVLSTSSKTHCIKYARVRVFTDAYSSVKGQNLRFGPYTKEYRSLKIRIVVNWIVNNGYSDSLVN